MTSDVPKPFWNGRNVAILAVLLFLAAILFTAINLQISQRIGRLSSVPNYDDVVYLNSASTIYFLGKTQGIAKAAATLFGKELHAPFPVLNGLAGFVIFGPNVKHIYYMLTLVVFAYLCFAAATLRRLPPLLLVGAVLGALGLPFATACALEFRPDMMWATLLGGSSVLFLSARKPFSGWKASALYGVATGAVLLVKPSTFAMTLLVLGGTWFLAAMAALLGKRATPREILLGLACTFGAALIVAGWYCIPHGKEIFDYFYENSFGANKDVWIYRGSMWERLTYYVRGIALYTNTAQFIFPLALVYIWGAVSDLTRGSDLFAKFRGGAFLWMIVCLFGVNAFFSMKSPFLGGSFYSFLIFGGLWYGARILQVGLEEGWLQARSRQCFAALALAALGSCGYFFPAVCHVNPITKRVQNRVNHGVLHTLFKSVGERKRAVILLTQGNPIVGENLQMEFRSRGKRLVVISGAFCRKVDEVVALSQRAGFVALQDQKMIGSPGDAIPAEQIQPELIAYFQSSPDWVLIGEYPDRAGKKAYLYQRRTAKP
jgi:hypothetical protein